MHQVSSVHTLSTASFPHQGPFEDCSYSGKLLVSGPDAAIEVVGKRINKFLFGQPSDNKAFGDVIDNYERSILKIARKLRKEKDDRVVFTGVWFHLDFDEEPWFEGYVIHVISADGTVTSRPYDVEMFDHDNPVEGRVRYGTFSSGSPEKLVDRLMAAAMMMTENTAETTSGIPMLQGVVWYPSTNDGNIAMPIVTTKLLEITRSDQPAVEVEVVKPDLTPEQQEFAHALKEAIADGAVTERLSAAYAMLAASEKAKGWGLRELQHTPFGVKAGSICVRQNPRGPIALSELANASLLGGYWFQVNHDDGDDCDCSFQRFDDQARSGEDDDRAIFFEVPSAQDNYGCSLVSDWHTTRAGSSVRYLACGSEPQLSW